MANEKIIHKLGDLEITDDKEILVPRKIRYISDWEAYSLNLFQFPHILDKKIPGCGYTEYCITCDIPIILCSPRKILLENKEEQHKNDVFYFRNELDEEVETDKDLTKAKVSKEDEESIFDDEYKQSLYSKLKEGLLDYLTNCSFNKKTPKILVTYDSFRLVKEILKEKNLFKCFYVVIDEFQSIFTDSRFKSTTEMEFINKLSDVQKVCYVSATPMIDKYLQELDLFKDLPYFELDWGYYDSTRITTPDLKIRVVSSIVSKAKEIIKTYKDGEFESCIVGKDELGNLEEIKSKEAVFYVNSVSNITSIIKGAGLNPEECNILCARTSKNIRKLYKNLGSKYKIGKVPLKGEPHKMFTFCTRTVYLGADFYSTNARTFILSDANIDCLAVDISLDLPQILGRQRDTSNPWKNSAEFYYKTLGKKNELTKEDFESIVEKKKKRTDDLLTAFSAAPGSTKQSLAEAYQKFAKTFNYKDDYVAVNEHNGSLLYPVVNELVIIAEKRAYDIQQVDYKDRFSVFNTIVDEGMISDDTANKVKEFITRFNGNEFKTFRDKMKFLCTSELTKEEREYIFERIPHTFVDYYIAIGPERCKALNYEITKLSREFSDIKMDKGNIRDNILSVFTVGNKYLKSEIKEELKDIYTELGYNKTPKANDLEKYFEIRPCKITNKETGKRDHGFEIIKRKENFDDLFD